MKKTDRIVRLLSSDIEKKDILEVACGSADFSVAAASLANSVSCIDLDDSRLNPMVAQSNVCFQIMDASQMEYQDHSFDTIVMYNAYYHIQTQWKEIEKECRRVLRNRGCIYIIGTWKLDTSIMLDIFGDKAFWLDDFLIVKEFVE
ncbi:class I SAM-dependent methyltransferase [Ruminococcus sp.]|uniref:class I SAM-dependent methyltransferase n=1 Tax=Ruminococcus sp. TaxID=41978 RepID=UPI0025EEA349|nr:class I SAM-dependent methyltransferase [Ruminococcus sp.]